MRTRKPDGAAVRCRSGLVYNSLQLMCSQHGGMWWIAWWFNKEEIMLVETIKGLLPRDQLEVKDIVTETDNSRCIATEWYYNGELVRRSAWADVLRATSVLGEQVEMK
jgi:hypothetical protein